MDEKELLKQIAAMFHDNVGTIERMIDEKITAAIEESERRTGVLLETIVVKRIDNLFDGYVPTRERQELMQTQMDTLAARVDTLELMVMALKQQAS